MKPSKLSAVAKTPKPEIRQRIIETRYVPASVLKKNPLNFRTHPDDQRRDVTKLLDEIGQVAAFIARLEHDGTILLLDGHLRTDIADDRTVRVDITDLTEEEGRLILALFDHTTGMAGINLAKAQALMAGLQLSRPEWKAQLADASKAMQAQARAQQAKAGQSVQVVSTKLSERFGVPPFSVLDTRTGAWQERKNAWLALGAGENHASAADRPATADIVDNRLMGSDAANDPDFYKKKKAVEASLGREITTEEIQRDYYTGPTRYESGSSKSDPALAEIMLRWFNVPGGMVFDPFSGPASIGAVAAWLGYRFTGLELRVNQCADNAALWATIKQQYQHARTVQSPEWIVGDAFKMDESVPPGEMFDMVYSSPPYFDLEGYGGGVQDGSAFRSYADFVAWMGVVAAHCARRLKDNRFFIWKVGEIRADDGVYRGFVQDAADCLRAAGLLYYNEIVIVNHVGSLAVRVGRQFVGSRKIGRLHQTMLVFYKGDPSKIKEHFPATVGGCDLPEDVGAGDAAESA